MSRLPQVTPGDLTLHDWGDPHNAPALLLMHGLTDSGECWTDAVSRWRPRFRVLSWDARGHGTSPRFTPGQLKDGVGETMLADAVSILESLADVGIRRPILVGHSMGGGTAGSVAATRPDLIHAAVLEDPALGRAPGESEIHRRERGRAWLADARRWLDDPGAERARGLAENPDWPQAEHAAWVRSKAQTDLAMLTTGQIRVRRTWLEVAEDIAVPTLLIAAADNGLWSEGDLTTLTRIGNPHLRVERLESGHCIRRSKTKAFHWLVDPWLHQVRGADRPR